MKKIFLGLVAVATLGFVASTASAGPGVGVHVGGRGGVGVHVGGPGVGVHVGGPGVSVHVGGGYHPVTRPYAPVYRPGTNPYYRPVGVRVGYHYNPYRPGFTYRLPPVGWRYGPGFVVVGAAPIWSPVYGVYYWVDAFGNVYWWYSF